MSYKIPQQLFNRNHKALNRGPFGWVLVESCLGQGQYGWTSFLRSDARVASVAVLPRLDTLIVELWMCAV